MNPVKQEVVEWLNSVVIGLNLCPFSAKPTRENRVRFVVVEVGDEESLLESLAKEMELLDATPVSEIETTLVIMPNMLQDFYDYKIFLRWAQAMLKRNNWQGVYQLASFHPDYCFAGAEVDEIENLTNRAPYPILHIIREESLAAALAYFESVDEIPEKNKQRMRALTNEEKYTFFPYLFGRN